MALTEREVQIGVGCFTAGVIVTLALNEATVKAKLKKANAHFHMRIGVINNVYKRLYDIKTDPTKSPDDLRKAIDEENKFLDMVINKPVIV